MGKLFGSLFQKPGDTVGTQEPRASTSTKSTRMQDPTNAIRSSGLAPSAAVSAATANANSNDGACDSSAHAHFAAAPLPRCCRVLLLPLKLLPPNSPSATLILVFPPTLASTSPKSSKSLIPTLTSAIATLPFSHSTIHFLKTPKSP
ncbi:hypothetical protein LB505_013560 [Fusarium chuoi]|nr:hypothetical protein LB505_013560 [Fusarium chuoi]